MTNVSRFIAGASVAALGMASTGCASLAFKPGIQSTGEYKNTSALSRMAEDVSRTESDAVKVMVGQLPDGMGVKEGALRYDEERYELLGKVTAHYKDPSLANIGLWFYGYKEGERWRTGLCAWQVPLSWVTFTMWSWLSPTYYPCRVSGGDPEDRRDEIVSTLKRAGKAVGADLVVVSGFGGINFVTVHAGTGAVVSASAVSDLNAQGYAFRVKAHAGRSDDGPVPASGATSL